MSVAAIAALLHDVAITLGIYALIGKEVTPNTIAALLTILGYSLYDTIVMFHRIKENSQHLAKRSFMAMANDSINEVLVRTVNTIVLSLLPVLVMLFFGASGLGIGAGLTFAANTFVEQAMGEDKASGMMVGALVNCCSGLGFTGLGIFILRTFAIYKDS